MANPDPNLTQLFIDGRKFSGLSEHERSIARTALLASGLRTVSRQYIANNSSTTVPKPITQLAVTSITSTGILATVTTAAAHYLITGDKVTISGANETEYNGDFFVTVTTTTAFTYAMKTATASPATGTILSLSDLAFVHATLLGRNAARTANTGNVWIGPTSANDTQPFLIPSDGEAELPPITPQRNQSLKDWYLDVATANDGLVIIFYP